MAFAEISRRYLGVPVAVGLFLIAAHPARVSAAEASYHLDGNVSRVMGAATNGLKALGVQKDAAVSIDWTVELTTAVHFDNPSTHTKEYLGAITAFKIQIGSWIAQGVDPSAPNTVVLNKTDIRDGPDVTSQDNMDLFRGGSDSSNLVTGSDPNGAQLIVHLFAPTGGASTSNTLGNQTPSLYLSSTGTVFGPNGEVDFAIPGVSTPASDPTVKCRASQIADGGALCQAALKCLAINAKAPAKDPGNVKLDACLDKARKKFVTAFDKAAATAALKGLSCGTTAPGATLVLELDDAIDDVVAVVDTINPKDPAFVSSCYTAASAMCSAAAKAESKDVVKPSPAKLIELRATARAKLTAAATKAVAKAEKKGVTFVPEPDIPALIASIDALIDDVVTAVDGP